ncbi:hypothetical protein BC829DRAFT_432296 [Chytridium lagenaria]|nr:hypothetical protein BC829DRAFT_432296 [Chytridium lagenaria]
MRPHAPLHQLPEARVTILRFTHDPNAAVKLLWLELPREHPDPPPYLTTSNNQTSSSFAVLKANDCIETSLAVYLWLCLFLPYWVDRATNAAARTGPLPVCVYDFGGAFRAAARHGKLGVVTCITGLGFTALHNDAHLEAAVEAGHLETVKFLQANRPMEKCRKKVLRNAIKNGHSETVN